MRKEIGPIASPDLIQWAPGLPKTRSGKIMRRILRKIAAAANGCTDREAGHLGALGLLIDGDGPGAHAAILAHLGEWPLDAMIVQPCCGVFGLIGFSGRAGREAEQLAFTDRLAPHLRR